MSVNPAPNIILAEHKRRLRDLPRPDAAGGADYYIQMREQSLAFDPRRRTNYERYAQATRTKSKIDYLPIKLDIENVSRCNFKCIMCVVSYL